MAHVAALIRAGLGRGGRGLRRMVHVFVLAVRTVQATTLCIVVHARDVTFWLSILVQARFLAFFSSFALSLGLSLRWVSVLALA